MPNNARTKDVQTMSRTALSSSARHDSKTSLVEEKSSKPPGHPKFTRRPPTVPTTRAETPGTAGTVDERLSAPAICRQMLMDGFVQSYVDFYHLTHRHDDNVDRDSAGEGGAGALTGPSPVIVARISPDELVFVRDNLVGAELARRQGDTGNVYVSFNNLADHYVRKKDWKTGFFFHEKCLEVAQLTNDIRAEMSAHHALGTINQLMNNYERARIHHEKHESLAISVDLMEEVSKSNAELYKVYLFLAEKCESAMQIDDALDMYHKCNEAAKKSWDKTAEAEANGRIGSLLLNRGQIPESVPYLKLQSQLAADLGNPEARCKACSALALAYELMGAQDKALTELQLVHTVSEQSGDSYLQAQACRALGTLYSKVGRLDSAVEILQRHFTLLKGLMQKNNGPPGQAPKPVDPTRKITSTDLDIARAFIGISKGNQQMGIYVVALEFDFNVLLDWKLNRSDLSRATDTLKAKQEQEEAEQRERETAERAAKVAAAAATDEASSTAPAIETNPEEGKEGQESSA